MRLRPKGPEAKAEAKARGYEAEAEAKILASRPVEALTSLLGYKLIADCSSWMMNRCVVSV